jgi:hypothetical protein
VRHIMLRLVALSAIVACGGQPMPVQLQGDPVSIAKLHGTWVGAYRGGVSNGGSLMFQLRRGTDSLYGDVSMMAGAQLMRAADPVDAHRIHVDSPLRMRIDFVWVGADLVRGTLEPYVAPHCDCVVAPTFNGRVKDDRIEGAFETRHEGRVIAEGSWDVTRQALSPR